jgi:hypothetical protein
MAKAMIGDNKPLAMFILTHLSMHRPAQNPSAKAL